MEQRENRPFRRPYVPAAAEEQPSAEQPLDWRSTANTAYSRLSDSGTDLGPVVIPTPPRPDRDRPGPRRPAPADAVNQPGGGRQPAAPRRGAAHRATEQTHARLRRPAATGPAWPASPAGWRPPTGSFGGKNPMTAFVVIAVSIVTAGLLLSALGGRSPARLATDRWATIYTGGESVEPAGSYPPPGTDGAVPQPDGASGLPPVFGPHPPVPTNVPVSGVTVPAGSGAAPVAPGPAAPGGQQPVRPPGPAPTVAPATPAGPPPSPRPPVPQEKDTAYDTIQGESYDAQGGVRTEDGDGGRHIGFISNGDWVRYDNLGFTSDAARYLLINASNAARQGRTGRVEVRLDSRSNAPIGSMTIPNNGSWFAFSTYRVSITPTTGVHTVYLTFTSGQDEEFANVDWLSFRR